MSDDVRKWIMEHGALFSPDRVYRYALFRRWSGGPRHFVVIGLNPSTADETTDDPTVRRCVYFAKREQRDALIMVNLFAFRATEPRVMLAHPDPIGADNDKCLVAATRGEHTITVAAWGAHGAHRGRGDAVRALIPNMRCFGLTRRGQPGHPLYLASSTPLIPLAPLEGAHV